MHFPFGFFAPSIWKQLQYESDIYPKPLRYKQDVRKNFILRRKRGAKRERMYLDEDLDEC